MPVRSSKSEEVILEVMGLQPVNMPKKSQNLRWCLGSQSNLESNVTGIETISSSVRIEIENRRFNEEIQEVWSTWSRADKIQVIVCIIILLIFLGLLIFWIYSAAHNRITKTTFM